jgi:hypothetical protein
MAEEKHKYLKLRIIGRYNNCSDNGRNSHSKYERMYMNLEIIGIIMLLSIMRTLAKSAS